MGDYCTMISFKYVIIKIAKKTCTSQKTQTKNTKIKRTKRASFGKNQDRNQNINTPHISRKHKGRQEIPTPLPLEEYGETDVLKSSII